MRLEDVRLIQPQGDPLLHHEALQMVCLLLEIDRRDLDRDSLAGAGIDCEMHVAAAAGMETPQDFIVIEHVARLEVRRQRQLEICAEYVLDLRLGQRLDADELDGKIVPAPRRQRLLHEPACSGVEIVGLGVQGHRDSAVSDVVVNAVAR